MNDAKTPAEKLKTIDILMREIAVVSEAITREISAAKRTGRDADYRRQLQAREGLWRKAQDLERDKLHLQRTLFVSGLDLVTASDDDTSRRFTKAL